MLWLICLLVFFLLARRRLERNTSASGCVDPRPRLAVERWCYVLASWVVRSPVAPRLFCFAECCVPVTDLFH